ncbi:MAG: hypothetical protein U5K74_12520 [Gemmatimonadaceae bacterium]|nr:hypothetical protein [Gemmatimonadaceae bacterium]
MAKKPLTACTVAELEAQLAAAKRVQLVVMLIFAVIILTWIFLGLWRKNVPVFISTLAVAVGTSAAMIATRSGVEAELRRRSEAESA